MLRSPKLAVACPNGRKNEDWLDYSSSLYSFLLSRWSQAFLYFQQLARPFLKTATILLIAMIAGSTGRAGVINFDDLPAGSGACLDASVPTSYKGLSWTNFSYASATIYPCSLEGYGTVLTSWPNVVYNNFGMLATITSTTPFTLNSGYFSGAWNDGLTVSIQAYLGSNLVAMTAFTVNTTTSSFEILNFPAATEIDFTTYGGRENPGLTSFGGGLEFAMDDLTVNATPEPPSLALTSLVFLALTAARRKF